MKRLLELAVTTVYSKCNENWYCQKDKQRTHSTYEKRNTGNKAPPVVAVGNWEAFHEALTKNKKKIGNIIKILVVR